MVIATSTGESKYLEAGQADFNPVGLVSSDDPDSLFAINASVVKARFSVTCTLEPSQDTSAEVCRPKEPRESRKFAR